ncbi:hypothetical protein Gpo141_00012551, partial [Globisporangium polare]
VQYDAHADMFEGLNRILAANPLDVIPMMASASINDESMILSVKENGSTDLSTS